jgi:hypothetical protein
LKILQALLAASLPAKAAAEPALRLCPITGAIDRLDWAIRKAHSEIMHLFVEAQSIAA